MSQFNSSDSDTPSFVSLAPFEFLGRVCTLSFAPVTKLAPFSLPYHRDDKLGYKKMIIATRPLLLRRYLVVLD